jgi:hypothetical protein
LGGASRAPAAKEAGATASNSSEGSERSGGGGKTGGGGGSSFLGLGGEGGGLGDILGGIKNPFETPAAVADGGALNFGLPPAADPLKLASAKEINVNAIAKDSVFAAVKTAIQRQRERGNTR